MEARCFVLLSQNPSHLSSENDLSRLVRRLGRKPRIIHGFLGYSDGVTRQKRDTQFLIPYLTNPDASGTARFISPSAVNSLSAYFTPCFSFEPSSSVVVPFFKS